MDDAVTRARREVERWFVARGVPQLIEGYGDEQRLDARATPLIAGWIALATVLWWANRAGASPARNAVTIALSLVFMASVYVVVSRLRGRRLFERPRTWDLIDIATFGLLAAIPALAVHGPAAALFAVGNALLGIGAVYLVIVFGIPEIAVWAVRRVGTQLEQIVRLIARTLPLLLILVVFLLFSAEIWEAAHALDRGEVMLVLALLALIAVLLILTTFQSEIQRIEARADWTVIAEEARSTPAGALFQRLPRTAPAPPPPFRGPERANLSLLVVVSQLVQSVFVGLVVAGFLVIFGLIAIPAVVQESWIGDSVRVLAHFDFLGEARTLSGELVAVAALLGAITGLYFTGLALTDAAYRSEYFAHVVAEVEQIASVRAVYLAAPSEDQASP